MPGEDSFDNFARVGRHVEESVGQFSNEEESTEEDEEEEFWPLARLKSIKEAWNESDYFELINYIVSYLFLFAYLVIGPGVCIYIGFSYHYCEDEFSIWLIIGGFLIYLAVLLFISTWCSSGYGYHHCAFVLLVVIIFFWWLYGFTRIPFMLEEPIMRDRECKYALFRFPFWFTMMPWIFLGWQFVYAVGRIIQFDVCMREDSDQRKPYCCFPND